VIEADREGNIRTYLTHGVTVELQCLPLIDVQLLNKVTANSGRGWVLGVHCVLKESGLFVGVSMNKVLPSSNPCVCWGVYIDYNDPSYGFMEGSEIRFFISKINLAPVKE
jgi:hypothetical protein